MIIKAVEQGRNRTFWQPYLLIQAADNGHDKYGE